MNSFIENYHKNLDSKDQTYYNYIRGKKVCIIGPSPSLNDKNLGSFFNSFDICVRVNQCIFLPDSNPNDYGDRTDIIYTSQRARDRYKDDLPEPYHKTKFIIMLTQKKWENHPPSINCFICNKNILDGEEFCLNADWQEGVEPKLGHPTCVYPPFGIMFNLNIPVIKRDIAIYQKLNGISLLTGVMAIIDMIQFHAKEIHIYGFDFYDSIKETIKKKGETTNATDIYCNNYLVFNGTMTMSHKDTNGQQLFLFMKLLRDFNYFNKKLNNLNIENPKMFIDDNLKSIISKYQIDENYKFNSLYLENYSNLIKDKKVVIVGPSPNIEGKNLGPLIDSYDVIIRLNYGAHLCIHNPNDFGTKMNVCYINHIVREDLLTENCILNNCEFIIFPSLEWPIDNSNFKCNICNKKIKKGEEITIDTNKNIRHCNCYNKLDYKLFLNKILTINIDSLQKNLEEIPLTGLIAIEHVLKFNPKELFIVGFDFFNFFKVAKKNGIISFNILNIYAQGYQLLEPVSGENKDINGKQLQYFKKLMKKYNNIKLEQNFFKILEDL